EERNPSVCEKNQTLHALIRQLGASSGDPLQLEARVDQGEGFPDPSLLWRSTKNPEEWCFGDFLGLPKEIFNDTFDPFGGFPWLREVGVAECRPMRTSRDMRSGWNSRPQHRRVLYFPHRRLWIMECLVGDPTSLEETVECDSERGK
ncbi:hypothetical protein Taro_037347, partial [Colocasia esculenta]|nr:hypothetical protein [Colocasia esculenta]